MKTLHLTGLALAIAAGFALPLAGSAEAAMGGALPSTQILPVEQAQFFFLGHNFCWYDDGWHGWSRGAYHGPRGVAPQVYGGHTPHVYGGHAPLVNVGRTPQFHSGAAPRVVTRGAAPSHGGVGGHVRTLK